MFTKRFFILFFTNKLHFECTMIYRSGLATWIKESCKNVVK